MTSRAKKGTWVNVLVTPERETALHELRTFGALCKQAKLGNATLEWSPIDHHRRPDELATFLFELPGLRLRLVDDPDLPAMFFTLSGDEATLQRADPLLARAFRRADLDGVLRMAEDLWREEPSTLILAALAPANAARLERVLAAALASDDVEAREAAVKAAATLGTPRARGLLTDALERESDVEIRKRLAAHAQEWDVEMTSSTAAEPTRAAPKRAAGAARRKDTAEPKKKKKNVER